MKTALLVRPVIVLVAALPLLTACASSPATAPGTGPEVLSTSTPPGASTSTTTATPAPPTALPAGFRSVCSVVDVQALASAVAVGPLTVGATLPSTQTPVGDMCRFEGGGLPVLSVTVGSATVPEGIRPFIDALHSLGATTTHVDGVGSDAEGASGFRTIWIAADGRQVALRGSVSVPFDKLVPAAKVVLPELVKADRAPVTISLPQCDAYAAGAAKVVGPVVARRDSAKDSLLTCAFGSARSAVTVTRDTPVDPRKQLRDAEAAGGPAPIPGVPDSLFAQGYGVIVSGPRLLTLTSFPTGDDTAAVALLKEVAAAP